MQTAWISFSILFRLNSNGVLSTWFCTPKERYVFATRCLVLLI